jgi:putative membrane protein
MTRVVKSNRNPTLALAGVAAVVTVLANILWAIFSGATRDVLTIVGVLAFSIASGLHAYLALGSARFVKFVSIALITTIVVEIIGVKTGIPFGTYEYDPARLGLTVFQVPLLIPFAWFMMLYPAWLVVNDLVKAKIPAVLLSALLMASWDLYLDPQMVNEGYWTWFISGAPSQEIPISNFVGWFVTAAIIFTLVSRFVGEPKSSVSKLVPYSLLLWIWLGSFLVNVVTIPPFLGDPKTAWSGFIGMGIVLLPWVWRTWRQR